MNLPYLEKYLYRLHEEKASRAANSRSRVTKIMVSLLPTEAEVSKSFWGHSLHYG